MLSLRAIWRSARPSFLLLTPVMLCLALALALSRDEPLRLELLPWLIVSALCAAIASNLLNEYFDFSSGLDQHTLPTPFSGGSQSLIEAPHYAELVKWVGLLCVSLSVWAGLYLVSETGWALLILGVLGIALLITYTPILNRHAWLCLLAPGLGYGLVIFLGSYWVLLGHLDWQGIALMPLPVFLVSALLLMNQFPDAQADERVGRRHAVIAWGRRRAYFVLGVLHGLSYLWLLLLSFQRGFEPLLWALIFMPISMLLLWLGRAMIKEERVLIAMGLNVFVVLGLPTTLALLLILLG